MIQRATFRSYCAAFLFAAAMLFNSVSAQPAAPVASGATNALPPDEAAFLAALKSAALKAILEDDKTPVVRAWDLRAKETLGFGKSVRTWFGTITEVQPAAGGGYHLVVRVANDEKNGASFSTDHPGDAEAASGLNADGNDLQFVKTAAVGQQVAFSGSAVVRKEGSIVLFGAGRNGSPDNPVYAFVFTRVVSAEQGAAEVIAEMQKMDEARKAAEAAREEASKPPAVSADKLVPGRYYQLSSVTPLQAALPSTLGKDAIPPPPIQIPADTQIYVHSVQPVEGKLPWYNVSADLQIDPARKKGWIDGADLAGETVREAVHIVPQTPALAIRSETTYQPSGARQPALQSKPKPRDFRDVYVKGNVKDGYYYPPNSPKLQGTVKRLSVDEAIKQGYAPDPGSFDTTGRIR